MNTVSIQPMTREICHEFYQGFRNDPAIGHYYEYIYTPEIADRYFDTNSVPDRKLFAILVDGQIIGECKLKNIDMDKRECSMGIHLRDDSVKGKGYGTQAERLILKYAFEELGMNAVNADAVLKNTRSQHVLEKVGFRYVREEDTFKYYRSEREESNMKIRKLTPADYDQVIGLYEQLDEYHVQARPDCFVHREQEQIYPRDAFLQNVSYPGGQELGAFDGETLVGIVRSTLWEESVMRKDLKTVCLDDIFVLPAYRRRGIAAKLFAEVEAWAKEQGAVRLELHTWDFNKGAIAMYEAMGMTPQRYVFEKKL